MKTTTTKLLVLILLLLASSIFGQIGYNNGWEWAKQTTGLKDETCESITVDGQGNQYITGNFSGTGVFGANSINSAGETDIFIAKLDSTGKFLWAKRAGGAYYDFSNSIISDPNGNLFITGTFAGTATFGAINLTSEGSSDLFVAKLDASGNFLWAKRAGGNNNERGKSITLDNSGNLYVTGDFRDTTMIGQTTMISSGSYDAFIAKLDAGGNYVWAKKIGGNSYDFGRSIIVDKNDNLYVTGDFSSTANFGSTTLTSAGESDMFVTKLNSAGNFLWAKKAGSTTWDDVGNSIAIDDSSNLYVTGHFGGFAAFGTNTINSSGSKDMFIAKLNSAGDFLWAKKAGGSSDDSGNDLVVDGSGNQFVIGTFYNSATFGAQNLIANGYDEIFITKINPSGEFLWARRAGGDNYDSGDAIAIDKRGNKYLTGYFRTTSTFGNTFLVNNGEYNDVFVAKIDTKTLTLISPNGGEGLQSGKVTNITWQSKNIVNIKLEYTTNGTTFTTIAPSVPAATGTYAWTLPELVTTTCKIRISDASTATAYDLSDNNFTILNSIKVLSPDGGQFWKTGVAKSISWSALSGITNVGLSYSTNNGSTWVNISNSVPAVNGNIAWTVPNTPSNQCLVKVANAANTSQYVTSASPFTIWSLAQTVPATGDRILAGGRFYISFNGGGIDTVKIEFSSNNGTTWSTVAAKVPFSGATVGENNYLWYVPNVVSAQCKVRITDITNPAATVTSGVFSIGKITMTSPEAGGQYLPGTACNIQFTRQSFPDSVDLAYSINGINNWITIANNITASTYPWTIPTAITNTCKIRFRKSSNSDCIYPSSTFVIYQNPVVTAPAAGTVWNGGDTKSITWTGGSYNRVQLAYTTNNGSSWINIVDSVNTNTMNSFSWKVPRLNSAQCKIRIVGTLPNNTTVTAISGLFTIKQELNISTVFGSWTAGEIRTISWTGTGVDTIKMEYSANDGVSWFLISPEKAFTPSTFNWQVPNTPSTQAKFRISYFKNGVVNDVSNVFTIVSGPIMLTAPNGGQIWQADENRNIIWNANSTVPNVKLEYSSNNFQSWTTIIASVPATSGTYTWKIPSGINSSLCRVRVSDATDLTICDYSHNPFTINNVSDITDEPVIVTDYKLENNFPNPFNPTTTINYQLAMDNAVRLTVYNAKGEEVRVLANGLMSAGYHSVIFDAAHFNSGVYFYKLQTAGKTFIKKMILLK